MNGGISKCSMLKRSGRAHDSNGIDATMEGACAVLCPACLQPGRNLPSNWRESPPTKSWLYGLFVGIDTNFHLKCKIVSKDSMDPSLSNGWGYFVKETVYKAFLNSNSNINQEVSFLVVIISYTDLSNGSPLVRATMQ